MPRLGVLLVCAFALAWPASASAAPRGSIEVVEVSGIIDANVERAIVHGLQGAERERASLVVLEIDSNGTLGADRAERIGARIHQASVPVAAWVAPGARARNGAALLWYAANARIIAPDATVGPVQTLDLRSRTSGGAIDRALARYGGRAAAASGDDAVRARVADFSSPGLGDAISRLDGRRVSVGGSAATVHVDPRTDQIRLHDVDLFGRVLHAAAQPSITYLLVLLGLVGLLFEAFHPSTGPAGAAGAAAMALAVYGITVLGGSWLGFALIVAGVVGFAIDLRYATLGPFTAGGLAGLTAGSILLFQGPWLRVPPVLIGAGILAMTAFLLGAMTRVLRDLRLVASGRLQVRDAHDHAPSDNGQKEHS
jgi:membrane-bound serine protease (ClpP class)